MKEGLNTDWNAIKNRYDGQIMAWEEKDDIQRLLSRLQSDAVDALNTALEYQYVIEFMDENLSYINKAPVVWSEVICSLRFTFIMKAARLFDESKDAFGLQKAFNKLENSKYCDDVKEDLRRCREEYSSYRQYIDEIRTIRDRLYAHNDKKEYRFWKYPPERDLEFEGEFWGVINEMLRWASNSLLCLRTITGDQYPLNAIINNDVQNLIVCKSNE